MFVRPPTVRNTKNPGRRPIQPRLPINEVNRPLLRQFVRTRRSEPRYEAYTLEVREGPAVNGNTNAAAGKSLPQPWVTVRDFVRNNQSIGLPVSVCDTLLKHLLTCVLSDEPPQIDSSEESELVCGSPAPATDPQASSPARASGDAKSPGEATSEDNSPPKKSPPRIQTKLFQLGRLNPIRIVCEATGCILEVTGRDPTAKRTSSNPDDPEPTVQADPSRRWIVSAPLETRPMTSTNSEQAENNTSTNGRRRHPWETRGVLELHESLMAQLSAFLADVVTRYRSVNQLPEVRSLYSASGGRRFFFDLRDTRWGKRLHISQVTELHRNVIGIPLEALVTFRTRLDMVIRSLGLEDQHVLKSEIYGTTFDGPSPRGQRQTVTSPRDGSNDAADSGDAASGGRKSTPMINNRNEQNLSAGGRQRGRERRRMRIRSFTAGGTGAGPIGGRELNEHPQQENYPKRNAPNGMNGPIDGPAQWNNGGPRNRRFPRRNRNTRPFNRTRRGPPRDDEQDQSEPGNAPPTVQSAPEPAIDSGRVAPVAEASA